MKNTSDAPNPTQPVRHAWKAPRVSDLPRLTELTLQAGPNTPGGGGGGGGGGSTVIA